MCHCREAKDRKYHKPNKEHTPRPPTVVRSHFISRITGFADVLDISFSLIIKSIPKLILEVIRGRWACRDPWATSTCYMFSIQWGVLLLKCFFSSQLWFWPFWSSQASLKLSASTSGTWQHCQRILVAFTLNKACFCGILRGRTCNLELRCCADQFTVTLLITRAKVVHQQREWLH